MKKSEIKKRLEELIDFLEMDSKDLAEKYSNLNIKPEDAYAFKVGYAKNEIKWILED